MSGADGAGEADLVDGTYLCLPHPALPHKLQKEYKFKLIVTRIHNATPYLPTLTSTLRGL